MARWLATVVVCYLFTGITLAAITMATEDAWRPGLLHRAFGWWVAAGGAGAFVYLLWIIWMLP